MATVLQITLRDLIWQAGPTGLEYPAIQVSELRCQRVVFMRGAGDFWKEGPVERINLSLAASYQQRTAYYEKMYHGVMYQDEDVVYVRTSAGPVAYPFQIGFDVKDQVILRYRTSKQEPWQVWDQPFEYDQNTFSLAYITGLKFSQQLLEQENV